VPAWIQVRISKMDILKSSYILDCLWAFVQEATSIKIISSLPIVFVTVVSSDCIRQYLSCFFFIYPNLVNYILDALVAFEYFIMAFEVGAILEEFGFR